MRCAVPGFGEGAFVLAVDALHIARRGLEGGRVGPLTRLFFFCKAGTKRAAAPQLPSLHGVA